MRLFTPIGARGESNFTRKACRVSNGVNAGVEGRHKPGAKWALERQALSNVTYASVLRTKRLARRRFTQRNHSAEGDLSGFSLNTNSSLTQIGPMLNLRVCYQSKY